MSEQEYKVKISVIKGNMNDLNEMKKQLLDVQNTYRTITEKTANLLKNKIIDTNEKLRTASKSKKDAIRKDLIDLKKELNDTYSINKRNERQVINGSKKEIMDLGNKITMVRKLKYEFLTLSFVSSMVAAPFVNMINSALQLTGIFEIFSAVMNSILLPVLLPLIKFFIGLSMKLSKSSKRFKQIIAAVVIFIAVFFMIIAVVALVAGAIFAFAILAESSIIGLIVAIAAIITLLIVWLEEAWNNFKDFFKSVADGALIYWDMLTKGMKENFGKAVDWIKEKFKVITDWYDNSIIKKFIDNGMDFTFGGWGDGSKQFGGEIKQTGLYLLHSGEEVISNSPSGYQGNTFNNTFNNYNTIGDNIDIDSISRRVSNKLGEMIL